MLCAQHSGWSQSRVCVLFFFFFWLSRAPVCLSMCACKSTVACVNPPVEPCSQSSSFWNQAWIIKPFHKAALTIYYMRGNRSSSNVRKIVCMGVIGLKKTVNNMPPSSLHAPYTVLTLKNDWQLQLQTHLPTDMRQGYIWVIVSFNLTCQMYPCHKRWCSQADKTQNLCSCFYFFKMLFYIFWQTRTLKKETAHKSAENNNYRNETLYGKIIMISNPQKHQNYIYTNGLIPCKYAVYLESMKDILNITYRASRSTL